MTAKSIAIKRRGGRSGGRVAMAVKLTSGEICIVVLELGLGWSRDFLNAVQKSAEGEVGR